MNARLFMVLALTATVRVTGALSGLPLESSAQLRLGFDTNPIATGGTSAAVLGGRDSVTYAAGFNVGVALVNHSPAISSLKLSYAGETVRFERWSAENFSTHRLGVSGHRVEGVWKFSAEGSTLFVDGERGTLPALSSGNANATALWRERRRQWQHRLRMQAEANLDTFLVRGTGTLLDCDYRTDFVAGHTPFTDRADLQGGLDLGWKQTPGSLWLIGARAGRQEQAIAPLPNCEFDYSNRYHRLSAGWEGKPREGTVVTFAAGPDFRRYTGAVDTRVFSSGTSRTSLWYEAGFAAKMSPAFSLSGKAARMNWLSSTGKSAYTDSCAEIAAHWILSPRWTARATGKIHRCEFFPAVRDDWESFLGTGVSVTMSRRAQLTIDVLSHRAWNDLDTIPERKFQRVVFNVGITIKL